MIQRPSLSILLGLGFIVVWVYLQFPILMTHLTTAIPAELKAGVEGKVVDGFWGGDHIQLYYLSWKIGQALTSGSSLLYDTFNFVSQSGQFLDLHLGLHFFGISLHQLIFGDVLGYNLATTFTTLSLCFLTGFFMARQVTTSPLACGLAGLLAATAPYHLRQIAAGHGGGIIVLLVPLYLGLLLRHQFNDESRYNAWGAGLVLLGATMSEEHIGYYLFLLSLAFGFFFLVCQALPRSQGRAKSWAGFLSHWKGLLILAGAAVGYGIMIKKLLLESDSGLSKATRELSEIQHYSKPLSHFLDPSSGADVGSVLLPVLALCLCFLIAQTRFRKDARLLLLSFLCGITVASALLMVGIGPHWSQKLGAYKLAMEWLPYFSMQRYPGKMSVVTTILVVLALSLAFEMLRQTDGKGPKWSHMATRGLQGVIIVGLLAQLSVFSRNVSQHGLLLETIAGAMPDDVALIERETTDEDLILLLPMDHKTRRATLSQLLATQTHRRYASGYHGLPPHSYMVEFPALTALEDGTITREAAQALRSLGVTHLAMDRRRLNRKAGQFPWWHTSPDQPRPGFGPTLCEGQLCLCPLQLDSLPPDAELPHGWTGLDRRSGHWGRYMMRGAHEAAAEGYEVVSPVQVSEGTARVRIVFDAPVPMSVWVWEEGGKAQEFPPSAWEKVGLIHGVTVSTNGNPLLMGVKEPFLPMRQGILDYGVYGVFVHKIEGMTP